MRIDPHCIHLSPQWTSYHPKKPQIHADEFTSTCLVWRGPDHRKAARDCRAGQPCQYQALVPISRPGSLRSLSAGLANSLLHSGIGKVEGRQKRHAKGASAGEKTNSDGCSHPERWVFSPATGDSGSPVLLTKMGGTTNQAQHPPLCVLCNLCGSKGLSGGSVFICVICGQDGWVAFVNSSCLRAFVVATWVAALCPLRLCGFSVNENALLWTFQSLFGYC